jgi:hypothetical protein
MRQAAFDASRIRMIAIATKSAQLKAMHRDLCQNPGVVASRQAEQFSCVIVVFVRGSSQSRVQFWPQPYSGIAIRH